MPETPQYFNRDLSWLKFNERVLAQAQDHKVPLLERVRFLAIFSTNLDEFFMKRVGHLKRHMASPVARAGAVEDFPAAQLFKDVRDTIVKHMTLRHQVYEKLCQEIAKSGIHFLKWQDLSEGERKVAKEYFLTKVFPVLTPLAVDKAHPFPFLSNLYRADCAVYVN